MKLQPAELSLSQFKSALRGGIEMPGHTKYAFNSATNTAALTVTVPSGAVHTVEVVFLRYPRAGTVAPAAPHDRPGRARLAVDEVSPGKYSATVYLHARLSREDTRLLANVELREIAEIVHSYPGSGTPDFTTHRATEERPTIFHQRTAATATTTPTSEDRSSAQMLRQLWQTSGFEHMAVEDVPPGPARDRLDHALSELGFGRVANHDDLVTALAAVLGKEATPKFIEFVRQYRWRSSAEVRLAYYQTHGFPRIQADPNLGAPAGSLISQQLIEHLVVPQGRTTEGVTGGHLDAALMDFQATHPDYAFAQQNSGITGEGIAWTRYEQRYRGVLVVLSNGNPLFKTTVTDIQGFMEMLERTVLANRTVWSTWPSGHRSFGQGLNHPALISPKGTRLGGALVITRDPITNTVTDVRVVAGWLD